MRPFTCQAACEAKWRRRGPTRRDDPGAGCDALPALDAAQLDAVRALWRDIDEAFLVRARLRRCRANGGC